MDDMFSGKGFRIRPITDDDFASTLAVYKQSEDFLALGPVAKASREMVQKDIRHSKETGGIYCGIWDDAGEQAGVLDYIPEDTPGTAVLSLLMISGDQRNRGLGTAVMAGLEAHLKGVYGTKLIESGVQVNNENGIRFWTKRGFQIDSRAQDLEDGTTAYQMSKRI
jgi:ribosomal protein S18 acetylase RimI-like enzyme